MSITYPTPITPWGTSRLAPYTNTVQLPHASVTIDPDTQLGIFRDRHGEVVEMGQHGTAKATASSETTSPDGQPGATDQRPDQDDEQD
ncbi:putative ATP-grasp-modified RiPP [Streptomyces sp. NBC_00091]|uniref:putative ATP-grasp-modified RiPP n=1 Tax=Streptomyces sp. NBC_00091 TaxID=2975648 RepID=UPI002257246D|nr:putative ATP-grasp-modified RiPP [Streptomyces sp. NBC_00091]MCX5375915.1 putative ATP-grasp-modified RiPP [Streptomyces sp. NBC_00091]